MEALYGENIQWVDAAERPPRCCHGDLRKHHCITWPQTRCDEAVLARYMERVLGLHRDVCTLIARIIRGQTAFCIQQQQNSALDIWKEGQFVSLKSSATEGPVSGCVLASKPLKRGCISTFCVRLLSIQASGCRYFGIVRADQAAAPDLTQNAQYAFSGQRVVTWDGACKALYLDSRGSDTRTSDYVQIGYGESSGGDILSCEVDRRFDKMHTARFYLNGAPVTGIAVPIQDTDPVFPLIGFSNRVVFESYELLHLREH